MSVIPNTNPSSLSYTNNLVFNQLLTQMNPGIVYELSNRRSVFNAMLRLINQKYGGSTAIYTKDIVSASRGIDFIQTRVLTRTAVGSELKLTFDTVVDGARINDKVLYNNAYDTMGRITAVQNGVGGFIVVSPLYGTAFTASDFAVGAQLAIYGDSSVNLVSSQKQRRFLNPTLDFNYTATQREGYYVARREKVSTRVTSNGSQPNVFELNGQWYNTFQQDMLMRLEASLDFDRRFSNRGIRQDPDGERTQNGGVRWAIKNRGGDYLGYSTPLAENAWNNLVGATYDKNIGTTTPILFFAGRGLWKQINNFYRQPIENTGILNTFAGKDVKGFNIPTFYVPGIGKEIAYIEDPLFNEPRAQLGTRCTIAGYENFTVGQMTGFLMSDMELRTTGGGMEPMFKQYHYGPSEYMIGELKGLEQAQISNLHANADLADAAIRANPLTVGTLEDATSVGVLTDSGIDGYGYGCGWIEPAQQ